MTEEKKLNLAVKRLSWKKLRTVRNPKWKGMINRDDEDKYTNSEYIHVYKGGVQGEVELEDKIHISELAEYKKNGWKTTEERIRSDFYEMAKGAMYENKSSSKETMEFMFNSGLFKSKGERIADLIKPELKALGMGRNMEGQANYDPTKRKGTFTSISDIEYLGAADYNGNSGILYSFKSGNKTLWYFTANSPKSDMYQSKVLSRDPR